MTPDTLMHLATSVVMLIFGVGAWVQKRKSGEATNAADIGRLCERVEVCEGEVKTKVGWKDFDRVLETERRTVGLQFDNMRDRFERVEKKVFNGGGRHG